MTQAEIKENLLVALDTLRTRKVRSALTILGIVIGVTSVIAVAAIIDGLNGFMEDRIKSFGSRSIFVTRIPAGYTGGMLPHKIRMRKYLEIGDARYLKETVPGLDISTAFMQRIDVGADPRIHQLRAASTSSSSSSAARSPITPPPSRSSRWPPADSFPSSTKSTRATWW